MLCATVACTREVHVRPSNAVICPSLTCYTLDHILQNPSQYLVSNTTIIFLAGVYKMSTEGQVLITNVSNLAFIGSTGVGHLHSRIQCKNAFGLVFISCSNISISHLSMEECGTHFTGDVLQRYERHLSHNESTMTGVVSAVLVFMEVTSLNISGVSVIAPKGYGLLAMNVFNSNITGSTFSNSSCGNLQLYYTDSDLVRVDNQFHFKIVSSQFMHGTCNSSKHYGCGLSVVLLQLLYCIDIQIINVTASNNLAWNGANIFMYGNGCTESVFKIENTVSMYGKGNRGTGLLFQWGSQTEPSVCTMRTLLYAGPVLLIEGSTFIRNTANRGPIEISIGLNPSVKVGTNYLTLILKNSSIAFNRVTNFNSTTALLNFTGCETALFQDVNISHNSYNVTAMIIGQDLEKWNQVILGLYNSSGRRLLFTCHNCNFSYNTNSTVLQLLYGNRSIYFQGITTFTKNGNLGTGEIVYLQTATVHFNGTTTFIGNGGPGIEASVCTLYFVGNTTFKRFVTNKDGAAIQASVCNLYFVGNTHFEGNEAKVAGGAIALVATTNVYTTGNLTFVRNKAKFGGAMLVMESQIIILTPAQMNFSYNTASLYGGGVYVLAPDPLSFHQCFMQFSSPITVDNFRVTFIYNKAGIAGSALYGESFDTCVTTFPESNETTHPGFPGIVIEKLFQFESNKSDLSVVSSEAGRVCICEDNQPHCQIIDYNTTVYPGETFTLSLVGVGQMLGAVPATVQAELSSNISDKDSHSLGEFQNVQLILEPTCTAVNYSVFSSNSKEVLVLIVDQQKPPLQPDTVLKSAAQVYRFRHHSVNINLTLAACPPGFTLSTYPFECTCTPTLKRAGILCDINTKFIHKPRNYWIGVAFSNNGTNDAVVHLHCPYDFCKSGSMNLNLEYPDNQCQYNRSSILCGSCKNNFSLALGTSRCLQCSNIYLLLIGPFALTGIALITILIFCNSTVSVGTVNGLIFYANVVRTNQEIFFPATVNGLYRDILTTFIAWLNLDLGIQTCFWDGLDAYEKVWLQLIFPVYIWVLIGAIVVLSDRFTTVARLSGRNAVPVLATLFLLSYAKLLRVVVTALAYTTLEYPDGTVVTVWLYDGNVRYLDGKHIPLFLVALAILLFLTIPYTVVLVFAQCLQQKSSYRALFWVRKMKPLFDSYIGCYKDKHRYWTGLLLVARAVLILVYALTSLGDPAVNLLSTISVVFGLTVVNLAIGGAYKQWILTLLEQSFLLNLGILSAATQYTRQESRNQTAVAYTSVTVSLATSAGIFLYHTIIALRKCRCLKRSQTRPVTMVNIAQDDSSSDSDPEEIKPVKSQVLVFDEFREPVLDYCNDD